MKNHGEIKSKLCVMWAQSVSENLQNHKFNMIL